MTGAPSPTRLSQLIGALIPASLPRQRPPRLPTAELPRPSPASVDRRHAPADRPSTRRILRRTRFRAGYNRTSLDRSAGRRAAHVRDRARLGRGARRPRLLRPPTGPFRPHLARLVAREPWPQDEATATGLDFAQFAMLRLLFLQRDTRRAVRTRQREATGLLARTSMETCILGLWCLHKPDAASKLRASE
jgi:hypothetical protein